MNRSSIPGITIACLWVTSAISAPACANIQYTVSYVDPSSAYTAYYSQITANLSAAGAIWSSHLVGTTTINLQVKFDANIPTANAGSTSVVFAYYNGNYNVYNLGAADKVIHNTATTNSNPDGVITIGTAYLQSELWFDPNPNLRIDQVPINQTDAMSVFTHELGHIFGFNGYRNASTGNLPLGPNVFGNYMTRYDENIIFSEGNLYFNGASARAAYGNRPVPLTFGNYGHVGNDVPRVGSDLVPDLMNGVVYYRGTRYEPSAVDLGILSDVGFQLATTAVPEPPSLILITLGVAAAFIATRSRFRAAG